tara:strand:+ start:4829 stop:4933 length:105 start_codon:yes stop_codon:yes gene_type:complete
MSENDACLTLLGAQRRTATQAIFDCMPQPERMPS